jgi:hypothetical protein
MSNKKQTPVSWLMEEYYNLEGKLTRLSFEIALQMESKKQQKYDEMLAMLERIKKFYDIKAIHEDEYQLRYEIEQLIKEAKEL